MDSVYKSKDKVYWFAAQLHYVLVIYRMNQLVWVARNEELYYVNCCT